MIIQYNIDKIRDFLNDFYKITGLTISIWDSEMNQMAYQPARMADFCRLIKSSPLGKKRCLASDRQVCQQCSKERCSVTHKCHAGLTDTAVPLILDDTILGYIMFGQVRDKNFPEITTEDLKRLGADLNLPVSRLLTSYQHLESFDTEIIHSAANILSAAILSLYRDHFIHFTENELVSAIDDYIRKNLADPISIDAICHEFQIKRNRLYSLWNKWFGKTIGEHILELRMKEARNLLVNTDTKISSLCILTGIPDYNYFSKVFKKFYGLSPREYRKQYPVILEKE